MSGEFSLRRLLGLYFIVAALLYIPAGVAMFGVENPGGPRWLLPVVSFTQAVTAAAAGIYLFRGSQPVRGLEGTVALPSFEELLQLLGVYCVVEGLTTAIRAIADAMFVSSTWQFWAGTLAAATVWMCAGGVLAIAPRRVAGWLRRTA